jgi:hypothetical protein
VWPILSGLFGYIQIAYLGSGSYCRLFSGFIRSVWDMSRQLVSDKFWSVRLRVGRFVSGLFESGKPDSFGFSLVVCDRSHRLWSGRVSRVRSRKSRNCVSGLVLPTWQN